MGGQLLQLTAHVVVSMGYLLIDDDQLWVTLPTCTLSLSASPASGIPSVPRLRVWTRIYRWDLLSLDPWCTQL